MWWWWRQCGEREKEAAVTHQNPATKQCRKRQEKKSFRSTSSSSFRFFALVRPLSFVFCVITTNRQNRIEQKREKTALSQAQLQLLFSLFFAFLLLLIDCFCYYCETERRREKPKQQKRERLPGRRNLHHRTLSQQCESTHKCVHVSVTLSVSSFTCLRQQIRVYQER